MAGWLLPLLAAAPAALARPDDTLVASVAEGDLIALVAQEGTVLQAHPVDAASVAGQNGDGLTFFVYATDCPKKRQDGCTGIVMRLVFDAGKTTTMEQVNAANLAVDGVTAVWDRDTRTVQFTRYVTTNGGVTWGNLRANLRLLFEAGGQAAKVFRG